MKKSLAALAVLGSFAGAAAAQTNVTIYGVADIGLSRTDTSTTSPVWGLTSGQQSGSRIGFRGTEDLGGGLSALFVLENGFSLDDGSLAQGGATPTTPAVTRLWGRQAYVGLKGSFGTIKLGRQETPMHVAHLVVDPFGTNLAGNIQNLFNAYGIRMDNTINYSLTAGAFSGELAYGVGEAAGSTSANHQLGLNVRYANGPVKAVLAYHQAEPGTAAATRKSDTVLVGGTYDFKVAKAHFAFADNGGETTAGVTDVDSREYMLGLSAPVGAGTVLASYLRRDDRLATGAVDADQYAIGYLYSLSKRTNLYTSYSKLDREPATAVDSTRFNVGVRHRF